MWRRAGAGAAPLRHHLAAAAGRLVNRRPLPPVPTASSSPASVSPLSQHNHRISASAGAPFRSLSNQSGGGACWSCGGTGAFLSCGSCGSVQPVDPAVDYFQIFGLKREYNIKDNNLEGKYKDWQKKLHPDLVHSKSEKERGYAAEHSTCD